MAVVRRPRSGLGMNDIGKRYSTAQRTRRQGRVGGYIGREAAEVSDQIAQFVRARLDFRHQRFLPYDLRHLVVAQQVQLSIEGQQLQIEGTLIPGDSADTPAVAQA